MKLVSFNIWGGTIYEPLMAYLLEQSANTDIFCFQEVFFASNPAPKISSGAQMYLFEQLSKALPDFSGIFTQKSFGFNFDGAVDFPLRHGLAVFIKNSVKLISNDVITLNNSIPEDDPIEGVTVAQVVHLESGGKKFTVINYHGPARPGNKLDTEQRLNNSKKLAELWQKLPNEPKILCGDFNLYPQTQSIKILGRHGRDLVKDFNITNTRNEVSWNRHGNTKQTFADYMFVSETVKVKNFAVPYNEVSDHLPMLLEFEL